MPDPAPPSCDPSVDPLPERHAHRAGPEVAAVDPRPVAPYRSRLADARHGAARTSAARVGGAARPRRGSLPVGPFLDGLIREIQRLPESQRRGLASDTLQLVSADPLGPAAQSQCRERLAGMLGGTPVVSFGEDSTLIAGLALHASNLVISHNWRGDLDRILADLSHDG